ncbi:MAG: hypothetical protein LC131_00480 [Anaerolineae bacterium]|nr:hypothetical protein [Anaerolineae bacterium]HNS40444.1 hypothetical protein [Promineifilum sp.]
MKSSTTIILFLIMLLLVVAAGFVFLFQTELRFRDELRSLSAENDALRAGQASAELERAGVVATRDALTGELAVAQGDVRELDSQLVESQQTVNDLTSQVAGLKQELDTLRDELVAMEDEQRDQLPVARIVSPVDGARLPVSRPADLVLIAADNAGLTSLTLEVNGRRFATYPVDGDKLYARIVTWNAPRQEGDVVFTVRATNVNGVESRPQSITITLATVD